MAIQVVADGTDANSTNVAMGYARALVGGYAQDLLAERSGRVPERLVTVAIRVWFNPDLESRNFMTPGIVALLLLVITTNLSAMAIVREKELGTLEQLNVTPLARWELIIGKLLPYAVIGMIDVILVLVVAILWFEVPTARKRGAAHGDEHRLSAFDARSRPVRIDGVSDAAAGDDDDDLLFPDADDLSLGIHLPDREHAGVDSASDLPIAAALLPRHSSRDFPQGRRAGDVLAAGAGAIVWGLSMLMLATLRSSKRLE